MIETDYIPLPKAAEQLGTDAEMLLIAAMESRINAYVFIGRAAVVVEVLPVRDRCPYPYEDFVNFASLPLHVLRELYYQGEAEVDQFFYEPLKGVRCIQYLPEIHVSVEASEEQKAYRPIRFSICREKVLLRKADVEEIKKGKAPQAGTVEKLELHPRNAKAAETRKRRTDARIMLVLFELAGIDYTAPCAIDEVLEKARELNISLSRDTLLQRLKFIEDVDEDLKD